MTNKENYKQNYKNKITDKIVTDTEKYRQQYNLPVNTVGSGHNDSVDAFRHAYMSAYFARNWGQPVAKYITDLHEKQGNKKGQDPKESNMDLWNNSIGRKIAHEVYKEYWNKGKTHHEIEDITVQKIVDKINKGELITNPNDSRVYTEPTLFDNIKSKLKGISTGQAAPIENTSQPFTREQIGAMTPDEFTKNEPQIMQQLQMGQIKSQAPDFSAVKNSGRIFTREDIGNMSTDEYKQNEPQIMQQLKSFGIPSSQELRNNSGVVYVKPYTRSDGTEVRGYYRAK